MSAKGEDDMTVDQQHKQTEAFFSKKEARGPGPGQSLVSCLQA